jgi:hypothetical protein
MIHYLVNDKIIYNRYLAEYESYTSKKPVSLHFLDELYDQYDWSQEPEQSLEELMDQYAHDLRQKHDKLILSWSGGTDSHTIYNVFARNRIHIDEIFTRYYPDRHYITGSHVDWLYKNHWDPTTKIRALDLSQDTTQNDVYLDEDWIFKNFSNNMKFTWTSNSPIWVDWWNEEYGNTNWVNVQGFERPFVKKIAGQWYYYMTDNIASYIGTGPNYANFFLEPIINIKQAHILKRVYQRLDTKGSTLDWNGSARLSSPGIYRALSKTYGRHDELVLGSSHMQKLMSADTIKVKIDPGKTANKIFIPNGHGEIRLLDGIKNSSDQALGFANGIANLASNTDFFQHLNKTALTYPNQIFALNPLHSKYRYLGD